MRVRSADKKARSSGGNYIAAAQFKTTCLEILDRVRETGNECIVTKHGKPVARVCPCQPTKTGRSFFGSMKGSVLRYDRPFDPVDGEYDINRA